MSAVRKALVLTTLVVVAALGATSTAATTAGHRGGTMKLLAKADVVSLHLSLNDETRGMIDAARIARMKPGVILVNTARGALVDEAAMIAALKSGHIRHAALDVFDAEPLKGDHPLASMENVTLSSHATFRTLEASMTLLRRAIDIVRGIVKA